MSETPGEPEPRVFHHVGMVSVDYLQKEARRRAESEDGTPAELLSWPKFRSTVPHKLSELKKALRAACLMSEHQELAVEEGGTWFMSEVAAGYYAVHHGKTTTQALQALLEQRRAGPGGVKKDEGKARQEGEEEEGANDSTSAAQGMAAGSESKPDEESPLELFSGLQMKEPFVRDLASCNRDQAATLANLSAANLQLVSMAQQKQQQEDVEGRKRARVDDGMDVSEPDPPTWLQLMEKKRGGEVAAPFKTLVSQGLQHAPAPRLKGVIDMDNFMLHQHPGQMHSVTQTAFKVELEGGLITWWEVPAGLPEFLTRVDTSYDLFCLSTAPQHVIDKFMEHLQTLMGRQPFKRWLSCRDRAKSFRLLGLPMELCVALDDQVKVWEKCDQASVLSVAPFGNHYDIQGRPKTSNPKLDTAKYYGDLATLLDRVKKAFLRDVHSAGAVTPISLDYVAPSLARALKIEMEELLVPRLHNSYRQLA